MLENGSRGEAAAAAEKMSCLILVRLERTDFLIDSPPRRRRRRTKTVSRVSSPNLLLSFRLERTILLRSTTTSAAVGPYITFVCLSSAVGDIAP